MVNKTLITVVKFSFVVTIVLSGVLEFVSQICFSKVPIGLLMTMLLSLGIWYVRIPPPDLQAVKSVLGRSLSLEVPLFQKDDYFVKTVAHRGAGLDAPENSLRAFNLCADKGCDFIEFDVTLTSDGVPVVFHDRTLERMTDNKQDLSKLTLEELLKLDISIKHPFRASFVDTKIPTLTQTVDLLLLNGQRMCIDVKDNDYKMVRIINDLFINKPNLYSRAIVSSFFPNIIYKIRRNDPKIACSLTYRPHFFGHVSYTASGGPGQKRKFPWYTYYCLCLCDILHEWMLLPVTFHLLGLSAILLHRDIVSPKLIADWESKGVRVIVWTVNHPVEKQLFARVLKVTYMTDTLTAENSTHAC